MLVDHLYKIASLNHRHGVIEAELEINKDDEIFKGHFPGQPVLPGACILQMMKEVLQIAVNTSVRLKKANQMKFLKMIDPTVNNILSLTISYELADHSHFNVIAKLADADAVCFKCTGVFIAF